MALIYILILRYLKKVSILLNIDSYYSLYYVKEVYYQNIKQTNFKGEF